MPVVYLKDYTPSDYAISHMDMNFNLDAQNTLVTARLEVKKQNSDSNPPLVLNGGDCELVSIRLNGRLLGNAEYLLDDEDNVTILNTPNEDFELIIITRINPEENTELEGLYLTDGIITTQCEAEGFRNITFYLDRPDVLATFTVEIHADRRTYPVLLSNGNLVASGLNQDDATRHFVIYHDPIPKPSYLFALVGGQLGVREDLFTTRSGKQVRLNIFVPEENVSKTGHAMEALKAAMRFDEEHYDREYDLERYNIVGVPQFNAEAMENKGLNIFSTSILLAHPDTSTDDDYEDIYATIGHEYFHNWRGNRVTVKNWFQLSLKEGLVTITEQEFCQDLYQSQVPRIENIDFLQSEQFPEDSGPLAQPVMPEAYEEPDNLYTSTVYQKGAEILNMLQFLLGKQTFKKGCALYFAEHDGKAANIEDFLSAMEQASGRNLSQFLLWYQQAGTPELEFEAVYDASAQTYTLTIKQSHAPTPGQPDKKPLLIPIAVGLLNQKGQDLELQLQGEGLAQGTTRILELTQPMHVFTFVGIKEQPIPSLLRHFSAPVRISKSPLTAKEHLFLFKHDSDPINRWLVSCTIMEQTILAIMIALHAGEKPSLEPEVIQAFRAVLLDETIDPRLASQLLSFPEIKSFFEVVTPVDPELIYQACEFFENSFIQVCYEELKTVYERLESADIGSAYSPEAASVRCLRNLCLAYLMKANQSDALEYALKQLHQAANMTDVLGALTPLAIYDKPERRSLRQAQLDAFQTKWQDDAITIQHLFELYALSDAPDALDQIIHMTQSPLFQKENPKHIHALLGTFYSQNTRYFHDPSGRGYQLITDFIIELDELNPSSAVDLVPALVDWKKFEPVRQEKMLEQLVRLYELPDLSSAVRELVEKAMPDNLESIQSKLSYKS